MLEGHEDCPVEVETYGTWAEPKKWINVSCEHEHRKDLTAYDGFDTGPVVGYYCECCGNIWANETYVRG